MEESGFPEGETTQAFKERVIRAFIGILQENFKEAYEPPDSIEPGNRGQAEKHLGENEQNKEKTLVFIVHGGNHYDDLRTILRDKKRIL